MAQFMSQLILKGAGVTIGLGVVKEAAVALSVLVVSAETGAARRMSMSDS